MGTAIRGSSVGGKAPRVGSGWSGWGRFCVAPTAPYPLIGGRNLGLRPRLVYVALSALYDIVGLWKKQTLGQRQLLRFCASRRMTASGVSGRLGRTPTHDDKSVVNGAPRFVGGLTARGMVRQFRGGTLISGLPALFS